jgi:hypothetical protein
MSKILRVLLVLAIAAAVIGYFRNWYTVTQVSEEQKTNINIAIDRQRIKEDLDLAAEKAKSVGERIRSNSDARPEAESDARPEAESNTVRPTPP